MFLYYVINLNVHKLFSADSAPPIIIVSAIIAAFAIISAVKRGIKLKKLIEQVNDLTKTTNGIATGKIDMQRDLDSYLNINPNDNADSVIELKKAFKEMLEALAHGQEMAIRTTLMQLNNEKLAAKSEAQNVFFSHMSHEIRTPMNSILGIAQIMLHDDNLTESEIKNVEEIKSSANILLTIVSDMMDISQLEMGELSLTKSDYNFKILLDDIVSTAKFDAGKKKLDFHFVTYGEIPVCLYGDGKRVEQILENIISNAIKYTKKGSVTFRINSGDDLIFTIEDTGLGIAPENLQSIFAPFEKSKDNKLKRGTGLGLSIVKRLIEKMGGSITVKSEPEQGSAFIVKIPKVLGDVSKLPEIAAKSEFSVPKAKILIVDDNEINLHVASGLIETLFKAECDLAESGAQALEMVQQNEYDLVFMDHMMPDMDGVQTTINIRKLGGSHLTLPIIALTANAVIGVKDLFIRSGMNDFLSKPMQQIELQTMLMKWLPTNKIQINENALLRTEDNFEKSRLITALSDVRGLNINVGLKNVAYNESVFENSMKILLSKLKQQKDNLSQYLTEKDLARFSLETHGLKGSFLNCGFALLGKLAATLSKESEVDNYPYCRENLPFFLEKIDDLIIELSNIFEHTNEVVDLPRGTNEQLANLKEKLGTAIENYEYYDVLELATQMLSINFGADKNAIIKRMSDFVNYFDYDNVLLAFNEI